MDTDTRRTNEGVPEVPLFYSEEVRRLAHRDRTLISPPEEE